MSSVELPAGTLIPLLVVTQFTSGSANHKTTPCGTPIWYTVAEDVVVDGSVVVKKGALGVGKVTWSRTSAFGFVFHEPARLHATIESTIAVDNQPVDLGAQVVDGVNPPVGEGNCDRPACNGKCWTFNGSNTKLAMPTEHQKIALLQNPDAMKLVSNVYQLLKGQTPSNLTNSPGQMSVLARFAGVINWTDALNAMKQPGFEKDIDFVKEVVSPGKLINTALTDLMGSVATTVEIVQEVSLLSEEAITFLGGALGDHTIFVNPGIAVSAVVKTAVTVNVP